MLKRMKIITWVLLLGVVITAGGLTAIVHTSTKAAQTPTTLTVNSSLAISYADTHWQWTEYNHTLGSYCVYQNNGPNSPCYTGTDIPASNAAAPNGYTQPNFECAEFVARALAAEGLLPGLSPTAPPASYGSYQGYDLLWTSSTDSGRLGLDDYLTKNGLGINIGTNIAAASPGDLVFYQYSPATGYSHVALLVSGGLVDTHNVGYYHVPYDRLGQEGFKIIHITASSSPPSTNSSCASVTPSNTAPHSPVVVDNQDRRMEIFEVGSDRQLYYQTENNNGQWQGWHTLGGNWPGQPAIGCNLDGRLEIFIVGNQGFNGGGLFHAWQTRPGDDSSWTGWTMMRGAWPAGTPSVIRNQAGGLEVFMRGLDGNLYHAWQTTPSQSTNYTNWNSLGYPVSGALTTDPVATVNANRSWQVFVVGRNRQLYYVQEGISGWQSLGGSWPGQPAVVCNMQGELEVFIVGNQGPTGGGLFHAWQTSPESNSWTNWIMLPGAWHPSVPFVAKNSNGTMDVFLVGQGVASNGNTALYHDYENLGGTWSGVQSLGGYWNTEPSVTTNLAGGLEVFMTGESGQTYHIWESTPGNSSNYISWQSMGAA